MHSNAWQQYFDIVEKIVLTVNLEVEFVQC